MESNKPKFSDLNDQEKNEFLVKLLKDLSSSSKFNKRGPLPLH